MSSHASKQFNFKIFIFFPNKYIGFKVIPAKQVKINKNTGRENPHKNLITLCSI